MPSRANRRRQRRTTPTPAPTATPGRTLPFGRTTRITLGFLLLGLITVGVVALIITLTKSSGDDGAAVANTNTAAPSSTRDPNATSGGSAQDEADITALAAKSVNVLAAGEWPSLYDDFTLAFKGGCDRPVFDQAGLDSENALGSSLPLLEFKEIQALTITGDTATAVIVGHYRGIEGSEYSIDAAFAREDGVWKIAPAAGTSGCSAFNRQDAPAAS